MGKPNVGKTLLVLRLADYMKVKDVDITFVDPGGVRYSKKYPVDIAIRELVGALPHQTKCLQSLSLEFKAGKGKKVAYHFIPEATDQPERAYTYQEIYETVNKLANGLKSLGVKKGDRISIYMPMLPETVMAMLACAKIGAIHSLVFSGFSSKGFGDRVQDCEAKVVFTADGFYRRGKPMPLKPQADEGVKDAASVKNVIVLKRTGLEVPWTKGRDVWFHELVESQSADCKTEVMDAEERLFILYTSGTTGKPKGIEHAHGGYCVGPAYTCKWVFDLNEDDIYWCTADVGWITGHSYVAYGPLCLGITSVMYEGSP
ncbi:MAG TPA: AMP-binding protein, partial [Candidatus Methanomethylicus sp.]|nr:AMP-binding protein [Candidatus Methanomethylicus sp.]